MTSFLTVFFTLMLTTLQCSLAAADYNKLPVFFFHGVTGDVSHGDNFKAKLTEAERPFYAINSCENACTLGAVYPQALRAIEQIRTIISLDPDQFNDGYVFIAHSQGAVIARTVIEEMDDHIVKQYISLSGVQNGIFFGPQPSDVSTGNFFFNVLGPMLLSPDVFDFSKYTTADLESGRFSRDFSQMVLVDNTTLQQELTLFNLYRPPVPLWKSVNPFTAVINNLNPCDTNDVCKTEQKRRRENFERVGEAHFFASPAEDFISPWQSSHFGQYSEVESIDAIESDFSSLQLLPMEHTPAYINNTFGLKTLKESGRLTLHTVPNITHICWIFDDQSCLWKPLYDTYIDPLLA